MNVSGAAAPALYTSVIQRKSAAQPCWPASRSPADVALLSPHASVQHGTPQLTITAMLWAAVLASFPTHLPCFAGAPLLGGRRVLDITLPQLDGDVISTFSSWFQQWVGRMCSTTYTGSVAAFQQATFSGDKTGHSSRVPTLLSESALLSAGPS